MRINLIYTSILIGNEDSAALAVHRLFLPDLAWICGDRIGANLPVLFPITIDNDNDFLLVHDATDGTVKYVKASQLASVAAGQAGVIGAAEDGDYTDGLFADFTNTTPTGTAIDRFNEILKS